MASRSRRRKRIHLSKMASEVLGVVLGETASETLRNCSVSSTDPIARSSLASHCADRGSLWDGAESWLRRRRLELGVGPCRMEWNCRPGYWWCASFGYWLKVQSGQGAPTHRGCDARCPPDDGAEAAVEDDLERLVPGFPWRGVG